MDKDHLKKLRENIKFYQANLAHNRSFLKDAYSDAIELRKKEKKEALDSAIKEGKVSGQYIANIQKGFDFIKDIAKTTKNVVEWAVENKGTVGTAIAGTLLYRQFYGNAPAAKK